MAFVTALWGHRGAAASVRENTVAAFEAAVAAGADGVELDVRRAADGRLVVHHDELPPELPPWVPTLDEALDACGDLLVNVELKERLATEVLPHVAGRRVLVSSFDLDALDPLVGTVPTAWLVTGAAPGDIATCVERGHVAYHPHHMSVTAGVVVVAHTAGLALNTWTVN